MTKVIFRKFADGEIIALFPQLPGTHNFYVDCQSYMHVGQHSAAALTLAINSKPARPDEYAPLLNELKNIGYDDLKIALKITRKDYNIRKAAAS